MWKKLYSNSSLTLLAVLAAGIWTSNLLSIYQAKNTPGYADYEAALQPSLSPTSQLSCEQLYERRLVAEFIGRCSVEERMDVYSLDESIPPGIIAAAGNEAEEARLLRLNADQRSEETLRGAPSARKSLAEFAAAKLNLLRLRKHRRLTATAICADGTYSYSANRRETCSDHGGVAQWLSR